jgi:hypothetical protein
MNIKEVVLRLRKEVAVCPSDVQPPPHFVPLPLRLKKEVAVCPL